MRVAILNGTYVENIIEVDENNIPDWCNGMPQATDDAQIGGTYLGGEFIPPRTTPYAGIDRSKLMLTFNQLLIGLVAEQFITEQEGELWLRGTLPQPILDIISTMLETEQFAAKVKATRFVEISRTDEMLCSLALSKGTTDEQLDQFFVTYSLV